MTTTTTLSESSRRLGNFAYGEWVTTSGDATALYHAVTGDQVAEASTAGIDYAGMVRYAREVGGPALRAMTFHARARMLKAMAQYLMDRKEQFYAISAATGATRSDSWIDIEGGIGTVFAYASRGRRELPDETFYIDGPTEMLSKGGTFVGRHICVPLQGVAVHINAFNFPVWGMLEKLAPTLLAGVPAIVKPATLTSFLTEAVFRAMIESKLFPDGAIQLLCGSAGDLLDHLDEQCAVAFTGSATTGLMLKQGAAVSRNNVRFNQEADSLNFSMLGPDAAPGTEEFDLFIKEVSREMTAKAGQKCTAIRRTFVPDAMVQDVMKALTKRLDTVKMGDPAVEGVRMGPLAGRVQVSDVRQNAERIGRVTERVYGSFDDFDVIGADRARGAFFPSILFYANDPLGISEPHDVEAFRARQHRDAVQDRGRSDRTGQARPRKLGGLASSPPMIALPVLGRPWHNRAFHGPPDVHQPALGQGVDRARIAASTSTSMPGPGRAGGGEEMGGVRGVLHYTCSGPLFKALPRPSLGSSASTCRARHK